jgi:hypothetical protein
MQNLKDVTLITVTGIDVEMAVNALLVSSEFCDFAAIKLLSPSKPSDLPRKIIHVNTPPIDFAGYSKFMIESLNQYVDTEFCLVIQADGFLINPQIWQDSFLEYDYIGAPWPETILAPNTKEGRFTLDKNRVGNGGFSLRSKKLLEICSHIRYDQLKCLNKSEDLVICHFLYQEILGAGIKFAPLEVANQFSIESLLDSYHQDLTASLGFHGKQWLTNSYLRELASRSKHQEQFLSLLYKPLPQVMLNTGSKRVGRLDWCPCGSKLRYKNCHGSLS